MEQKKADLSTGRWDVLSLYQAGALNMLLDQISNYRERIVALQKMRWTGEGILEKYKGTISYSCDEKKHFLGTGFIIRKNLKHLVIGFSPRLATLRVKCRFLTTA
jgi:hypothetical protein